MKVKHIPNMLFKVGQRCLVGLLLLPLAALNADTDSGESLYKACAACHGAQAEGNEKVGAPKLRGLDASYITRQLENYQQGIRGYAASDIPGQQMRAAVSNSLKYNDMLALAEYISALRSDSSPSDPVIATESIYTFACANCHGVQAAGSSAMGGPRLNCMEEWYFLRQMDNFRLGLRGRHPGDTWGNQMALMSNSVVRLEALRKLYREISEAGCS